MYHTTQQVTHGFSLGTHTETLGYYTRFATPKKHTKINKGRQEIVQTIVFPLLDVTFWVELYLKHSHETK